MNRYIILVGLLLSCSLPQRVFAHNEWVHQYIIREAINFLEDEGVDVADVVSFTGGNFVGDGASFGGDWDVPWFQNEAILLGAWREDVEDVVFDRGPIGNGWNASATHFWDADNGDDATSFIITSSVENAWKKARWLAFGREENAAARVKVLLNITEPFLWTVLENGELKARINYSIGYYYSYSSLKDFFRTGEFKITAFEEATDPTHFNSIPPQDFFFPTEVPTKQFCYHLLGRIAHLLADMGVPAHTHVDTHPCPIPGEADTYETTMSGAFSSGILHCDDIREFFHAQGFNASTARLQGGLLWEVFSLPTDKDVLRYLFYTLNQLTDRWHSNDVSGDNNLPNGTNPYLDFRFSQLSTPVANSVPVDDIAQETFNFTIRATATLLYWYALRTETTQCPLTLSVQDQMLTGLSNFVKTSYEAGQNIISGANENLPSGSVPVTRGVTVRQGANIEYRSGSNIKLKHGFRTESGSQFHAVTGMPPCLRVKASKGAVPLSNPLAVDSVIDTSRIVQIYVKDSVTIASISQDSTSLSSVDSLIFTVSSAKNHFPVPVRRLILADTVIIKNANDSTLRIWLVPCTIVVPKSGQVLIIHPLSPIAPYASIKSDLLISDVKLLSSNNNNIVLQYHAWENTNTAIKIYDILGKEVASRDHNSSRGVQYIKFENLYLASGVYYISLTSKEGYKAALKFQVK